ncbi:MAG TPA: hypothetical protein VNY06_06005 [Methylocella sp.]|nr:hypothetical protein [Methylocella sp.]
MIRSCAALANGKVATKLYLLVMLGSALAAPIVTGFEWGGGSMQLPLAFFNLAIA